MVVFVDLDQDAFRHPGSLLAPEKLRAATSKAAEFPPSTTSTSTSELKTQVTLQDAHTAITPPQQIPTSKTPNCNAFSAALSCYPYVDLPPQSSPRPLFPTLEPRTNTTALLAPLELLKKLPAPSI
jgi:hypothetical protein